MIISHRENKDLWRLIAGIRERFRNSKIKKNHYETIIAQSDSVPIHDWSREHTRHSSLSAYHGDYGSHRENGIVTLPLRGCLQGLHQRKGQQDRVPNLQMH
jgi:hypothetical protein